ncbi:hypothetical protein VPH35_075293 [Triticum aestivum]
MSQEFLLATEQPSQSHEQQELHDIVRQEHHGYTMQQGGGPTLSGYGHKRKITLIPLVFLIYFEVAGGPYGAEKAVLAAGPLFTLLGFLIFPFAWGVPESLITAELATAFPGNGGFVLWADHAFGPLAGFLLGMWKYLSIVINIAAYTALIADYLGGSGVAPAVAQPGGARTAAVIGMTLLLSLVNYAGVSVVGWGAVALGMVSLAPFVLMTAMAVPKVRPSRWASQVKGEKDWRLFFNTLFWNLNYWDCASTMAGEVERPERTFPRALAVAVVLIAGSYLLPLMAATGATDASPDAWVNGYLADAAGIIGGPWLKYWTGAGAVISSIGMFEAQMSSGTFQLLGMADMGLLPAVFSRRAARTGTPLGTLLEFASFLWLRMKYPALKRPYRVPLSLPALVAMCAVPSSFLAYVCVVAGWRVFTLAAGLTTLGVGWHCVMRVCKAKKLLKFNNAAAANPQLYARDNYHLVLG